MFDLMGHISYIRNEKFSFLLLSAVVKVRRVRQVLYYFYLFIQMSEYAAIMLSVENVALHNYVEGDEEDYEDVSSDELGDSTVSFNNIDRVDGVGVNDDLVRVYPASSGSLPIPLESESGISNSVPGNIYTVTYDVPESISTVTVGSCVSSVSSIAIRTSSSTMSSKLYVLLDNFYGVKVWMPRRYDRLCRNWDEDYFSIVSREADSLQEEPEEVSTFQYGRFDKSGPYHGTDDIKNFAYHITKKQFGWGFFTFSDNRIMYVMSKSTFDDISSGRKVGQTGPVPGVHSVQQLRQRTRKTRSDHSKDEGVVLQPQKH